MEKNDISKYKNLNGAIDFSRSQALNSVGDTIKEAFCYGQYLESNKGDPEIMLLLNFEERVSLTGFSIDPINPDSSPKEVILFSGKNNLDFSDIDNLTPTEKLTLKDGKIVSLKLAKYKNIDSLTIFLKNSDCESLRLDNLVLYGEGGSNIDMSQMKNVSA